MKKATIRTSSIRTRQKNGVIASINQIRNKVRNKKKNWDSVKLLRQIRNDR